MLKYMKKETAIVNGQYGRVWSHPRVYSVSKGNKRPGEGNKLLHKVRLVYPEKHRYIFNQCDTYEKYVNRCLHYLKREWEFASKSPFLFSYNWDEDKQTQKAMEMALESLNLVKSYMSSPVSDVSDFEPLEVPDIPW